jgi:hypothetical protein
MKKNFEIKIYNEDKIIVLCDQRKWEDYFETYENTKWNSDGIIIRKVELNKVEKLIKYLEKKEREKIVQYQSSEEESDDDDSYVYKKKSKPKSLPPPSTKKNIKKYNNCDPMKYYQSFVCKPADFKKLNNISSSKSTSTSSKSLSERSNNLNYSSSSYYSSSTDGFPSPETPRKQYSVDEILELLEKMNQRIIKLEKKLK